VHWHLQLCAAGAAALEAEPSLLSTSPACA